MPNNYGFFLELNKHSDLNIMEDHYNIPIEYTTLALRKDDINQYAIIIKDNISTVVLHLTGFELNNFLMNSLEMFKVNDTKFKINPGEVPLKGKDYNELPKRTAK